MAKKENKELEEIVGYADSEEKRSGTIIDRNKLVLDYTTKLNFFNKVYGDSINTICQAKSYVYGKLMNGDYVLDKEK